MTQPLLHDTCKRTAARCQSMEKNVFRSRGTKKKGVAADVLGNLLKMAMARVPGPSEGERCPINKICIPITLGCGGPPKKNGGGVLSM